MKKSLIVLIAGISCGLVAHFAWFDARRPVDATNLEDQLDWVRATLRLNADQFAEIKQLHEEMGPRLVALSSEVQRMRAELARFEHERVTLGEVDFLKFARFIEEQRAVDRNHDEYSRRLVTASTSVMTPEQRRHYLNIVAPALSSTERESLQ